MPYRQAPLWLGILVPMIVVAFWPRYFGQMLGAPFALHAHGLTASAWILLTLLQSWSATRRRLALHRFAGRASFVVVPAFAAGGLLAMQSLVLLATARSDPFHATYGLQLALDDLFAAIVFLGLVWIGLAGRRQVALHGAAMLATVLLVLPPITARLLQILPLPVADPFTFAFHVCEGGTAACALWLGRRGGRAALPFRIAAGALAGQMVLYETVGRSQAWAALASSLASPPAGWVALVGVLAGATVCWWGWRAGARPRQPGSTTRVASAPTLANSAGSVPVIHT